MNTLTLIQDGSQPLIWMSSDELLRVLARRDTLGFDDDFYNSLSSDDFAKLQKQVDEFGLWVIDLEERPTDRNIFTHVQSIGGIMPDDDYTLLDAAQEHFDIDKHKPLGLFNWNRQNYRTRFAETIPFTPQYYPYPWEEIELVDLDEETLREIFIEMLDDTGKTDALVRGWNEGYRDKPDTITDIVMAHNKQELIDFILEEQPQATKSFGLFNWNTHNYRTRFAENFSAPFMDVTFQDTPMQVKHLYHGQHTVDGVEITPHSPYWTTDLALALGHALFGAEQEVTGADLLICSKCDGTHLTSEGEMCYSCDEDGYVLQETFTDDILPQTTPLVLSLDFTEPHTVYFTQDMEHDVGVSYLVESENFRWNFVPAETLLALLYTWLDTGLPELVEFDTGAGYVEHESSVTNRIQQAIHQLEQSAH